jgi:hypothetical protein
LDTFIQDAFTNFNTPFITVNRKYVKYEKFAEPLQVPKHTFEMEGNSSYLTVDNKPTEPAPVSASILPIEVRPTSASVSAQTMKKQSPSNTIAPASIPPSSVSSFSSMSNLPGFNVVPDEPKPTGPEELHFEYLQTYNDKTDERNTAERVLFPHTSVANFYA